MGQSPFTPSPTQLTRILQGSKAGKGGLDSTPSSLRAPPEAPSHLKDNENDSPERPGDTNLGLLPRESGEDIGMGSPVPLSSEAVGVITRLRNMKVSSCSYLPTFPDALPNLYLYLSKLCSG